MLENLKVKTRFSILIGVIVFILALIALMEAHIFNMERVVLKNIYDGGIEDIEMIDNIRDAYSQNILDTAYQVHDGKISSTQAQEIIKEAKTTINETWTHYIKSVKGESNILTNNSSLIERIENQMKEVSSYVEELQDPLKLDNKDANKKLGARELPTLLPPLLKDLRQLSHLHVEETANDYQTALTTIESYRTYSLLVFLCATLLLICLAIWIALSIINPLKMAVDVINKLTLGDLSIHSEHCSKSELGQLLEAMNTLCLSNRKMSDNLSEISNGHLEINVQPRSEKDVVGLSLVNMITNLKQISDALTAVSNGDLTVQVKEKSHQDTLGLALANMIKNLRYITEEIQAQVTNLTTSSQEIVTSVSHVATTSAETAAAITETTTSVEELKQSAYLTDEKAKDVLGNSEETLLVVGTCEKLLQNTMDDMKQISEKMHAISEGIVKLSEHSQTIGRIIETVNDLAERSNLLAVNAAIEAAKAGEHGKGFVVVAQEIRTLAEQSKSGTIQVRSILSEIQNYTTAAVLATEQGAKAVAKGVDQSAQTNKAMQTLSSSVTGVTQAANQIAISSQQQFIGVDQMTTAMSNIKEATTQLVDNMKQIESAVSSLNSIGENLKDMTDQYVMTKELDFSSKGIKRKKPDENYSISFDRKK